MSTTSQPLSPRLYVTRAWPRWGVFLVLALALFMAASACRKDRKKAGSSATLTTEQRDLNARSFDVVWQTVRDKHWDAKLGGVDWDAVREELRPKVIEAKTLEDARAVMQEMLERLKQSHFSIVPASAYSEIEGSEAGAGAPSASGAGGKPDSDPVGVKELGTTGIQVVISGKEALVARVPENSPAATAGLRTGWRIVRIEGRDVAKTIARIEKAYAGSTLAAAMLLRGLDHRLSGEPGTSLKVELEDGSGKTVHKEIVLGNPLGKEVVFGNMPALYLQYESRKIGEHVGYITFSAFLDPATTMQTFGRDIESFRGTKGLIIDLRGNPGGLGGMAMGMGGWLVTEADLSLGTMITRDTELKFVLNPRPEPYSGKVAVLIDGASLSTSEILAAGLRDVGRARLFGTQSGGAALPSMFERLPNGDGFQYAFGNYVSASGAVLEGNGVEPDVEVRPTRADLLAGKDALIDAAVAWIVQDDASPPTK